MTPLEDLSLLRAFVGIVASGSISAAARAMKVPQPILSRWLKMLEDKSGVVLLRRDTHRMSLTEAGRRLHEDAVVILELVEDATRRLKEGQTAPRGHLRLFATVDFGQSMVTRLISRFLELNPGVTAELGYTNRPLRMIEDGFDAGVIAGKITDDRVVALDAGRIGRYLVATPAFIEARAKIKKPTDLESWPWVSLAGHQFGDPQKEELVSGKGTSATVRVSPILTSEGVTSLREAVLQGTGIAVLPDWLVRKDLADGSLARVFPQWKAQDIPAHVIYPGERQLPARVRTFIDFAVSYMKSELESRR